MTDEINEILEVIKCEDKDLLETCAKLTNNVAELKEKHVRMGEILDELEYVCYLKCLWELHATFDSKQSIIPCFEWDGGGSRGYFVLKRKDGMKIRFPVKVKNVVHYPGGTAYGIVDMWNDDLIPPRICEMVLKWWNKGHPGIFKTILKERKQREDRQAKLGGHAPFATTVSVERPSPLVEPTSVAASPDEVWADGLPGDGESEEVEAGEGTESSESEKE